MNILNKIKSLFDLSVQEVQPQIIEPQIDEKKKRVISRQAKKIQETYREDAQAKRDDEYDQRFAKMEKEVVEANSAPCEVCGETKLITKYGLYDQKLLGESYIGGSINSSMGLFGAQSMHGDIKGNGSMGGYTEQVPRLVCTSCGNERLKSLPRPVAHRFTRFQDRQDYEDHFAGGKANDWARQFYVESHLAFANNMNGVFSGSIDIFDRDYSERTMFPKYVLREDLDYYRNMGLKFYSDEN